METEESHDISITDDKRYLKSKYKREFLVNLKKNIALGKKLIIKHLFLR